MWNDLPDPASFQLILRGTFAAIPGTRVSFEKDDFLKAIARLELLFRRISRTQSGLFASPQRHPQPFLNIRMKGASIFLHPSDRADDGRGANR
jgi:hypothetical protein